MKIGVIGAGTMGQGIAKAFAQVEGNSVALCDIKQEWAEKGLAKIKAGYDKLVAKGKIPQEKADAIVAAITPGLKEDLCADCDLVVEAAFEDMKVKQTTFGELDKICKPECIFASNTSSLSITEIGKGLSRPLVGMHFFNPADRMKLIEVIAGCNTPAETVEKIKEISVAIGKNPVQVNEAAGFVVNRIRSPYYINKADFVACHNPSYITKGFKMVNDVKPGGVFMINCQWDMDELNHHLKADAKRYIAKNNIQLYTIDAIDLAIEIGMGKRNNTILQSAFFTLAKVMPQEDAIRYMKEKAKASYLKKGQDVVDMNYKAIDLGATAFKKIDVPADWANAVDEPEHKTLEGKPELVKMVKEILEPVGKMDGDSLPVSAFVDHVDGQFELGASAYEKRGVAVSVPTWDSTKCIQCNQCAYVCPHATIRPFALTAEEAKNAPEAAKIVDVKAGKGKGVYQYTMAVSPLDCMGCGVCIGVCPVSALSMVSQEGELAQQDVFDYCVSKVTEKKDMQDNSVKGSQFKQPMLEFSGSCAGCAETSYARLVTQIFGDHMYISNATGCSSIWGGPAATSPYCTNKEGHGPAWCNSLFEDNAEHGLGMFVGQNKIREDLAAETRRLVNIEWARPELKAAAQAWLDTMDDGTANAEPTKAFVKALEESICTVEELAANPQFAEHAAELKAKGALFCDCEACTIAADLLSKKEYLAKKSMWIFGGDGWAYDIGYGGLDHVIASKQDVNIFVFDTEVYSNTGGQASKASNIGQVCQFAAAGKEVKKKSLAEIAMQYGYVYVAQVAMGANPAQTIKAITEAEAYHGPSLIIGYSPCEMHSIKGGMMNCQKEMKKAVECGYWNLFRFNPAAPAGQRFSMDSKAPAGGYQEFLMNEARYSRLTREFPDRAGVLFQRNEDEAKARYEHLLKLIEMYDK